MKNLFGLKHFEDDCAESATARLLELVLRPEVRFVGFGENHWWNNPQRQLVNQLMGEFWHAGYQHLALEVDLTYQSLLGNFASGSVTRRQLEVGLRDAAGSIYDSSGPCPSYFGMIEAARVSGMNLLAVDKDRSQRSWCHPDFAREPRDEFMAHLITAVLEREPLTKIIFYGGSNHLYRRPAELRQDCGSMAEHIEEYLKPRGESLFCVGAVLPSDKQCSGLSFAPLYRHCEGLKSVQLIAGNEKLLVNEMVLGNDRRCPWGGCFDNLSDECPGVTFDICQAFTAVPIRAGYWDALMLYPVTWGKKTYDLAST